MKLREMAMLLRTAKSATDEKETMQVMLQLLWESEP